VLSQYNGRGIEQSSISFDDETDDLEFVKEFFVNKEQNKIKKELRV